MVESAPEGGSASDEPVRPITIAILAMGGEGGGVLADWLVDMAEHAGWHAQTTSVPGVAQRTGATTYYLEIAREPAAAGGAAPVFALAPLPGRLDLLASSELLETARQIGLGMSDPARTLVIIAGGSGKRAFSKSKLFTVVA